MSQNSDSEDKTLFHSSNLADTKAYEKREVFTNVEKENSFKSSLKSLKSRFETEISEKLTKPVKPIKKAHHEKPPIKRIAIFISCLIVVTGLVITGIHLYPIIKAKFEISEEKALSMSSEKPDEAINMLKKIIEETDDIEEKAGLYLQIAYILEENGQINEALRYAYDAHDLFPSYTTAIRISELESVLGNESNAILYETEAEKNKEIILELGNG